MNKEMIPINKEILKWARTTMGLSIEDVSNKIHKAPEIIQAWENGEDSPTYPQLENIADHIYKRPVALFFFPSVPEEESPNTDFRSLPGTTINDLPSSIIKMYRKAKVLQLNIEELFDGKNPAEKILSEEIKASINDDTINLAKRIRALLGIDINTQQKWRTTDIALKKWRESLERNGIFVFKDAFHNDDFSGFCLHSEYFPVIFINNTMTKSRQVFTLFHELAHLLTTQGGIDFYNQDYLNSISGNYRITEYFCNAFAGEILVPSESFNFPRDASESFIERNANLYSVSRDVIARKLLDNKIIDTETYIRYVSKWKNEYAQNRRKKNTESSGNIYNNIKSYLGNNYIDTAFSKYYQNRISSTELADYLFMKVKNLNTAEHYMYT